jgi:5'-nucleotidase
MEKKPLILVTNDDGITAPGIRALVAAVEEFGEVLVVAPDRPQSGMGHAITVNNPLRMNEVDDYDTIKAYTCSGTPVDCVKLAIYEILKKRPALIVSGVNHGSNCSTNVLYSGTMSAAVEGALEGIPSIGFSLLDYAHDANFEPAKGVVKTVVKSTLEKGMPDGICLNVNIPKASDEPLKGIKVCRQAKAFWDDKFDMRQDPLGKKYYWLTGQFENQDKGGDTDIWALENNYVSVVPTQFDMTAHHAITSINNWEL